MKRDIDQAIASAVRCIREAEALLGDVDVLVKRGEPDAVGAAEMIQQIVPDLRAARSKIQEASDNVHAVFHAADVKRDKERRDILAEQEAARRARLERRAP